MEDLYGILGIPKTSTDDEIKSAFRKLAKESHPDANLHDSGATERFIKIRSAYEILSEPSLRENYDKCLSAQLVQEKKAKIRQQLVDIDLPTKIEIILAWSTKKPSFNTSFVCSCANRMAEGKELTARQQESIDNIISSFEINLETWSNEETRSKALNRFFEKASRFDNLNKEEDDRD